MEHGRLGGIRKEPRSVWKRRSDFNVAGDSSGRKGFGRRPWPFVPRDAIFLVLATPPLGTRQVIGEPRIACLFYTACTLLAVAQKNKTYTLHKSRCIGI